MKKGDVTGSTFVVGGSMSKHEHVLPKLSSRLFIVACISLISYEVKFFIVILRKERLQYIFMTS